MAELVHPHALAGNGFVLRPFTIDDVAPDHAAIEDPSSARWLNAVSTGAPKTVFGGLEAMRKAGQALAFTIAAPGDGRYLGAIILFRKEYDTGELAYVVAPEARGRGLARGAVSLLGDWSVANLGLKRLQLRIDPENDASHKVALACGYEREGVLRSAFVVRGERRDVVMYSKIP